MIQAIKNSKHFLNLSLELLIFYLSLLNHKLLNRAKKNLFL